MGPGALVAAAFIGPGTVTTCSVAGASFGYTLLWALSLSIVTTIILQEMSARIGLVSGKDLAQVIREQLKNPILRVLISVLMISAVLIGNAAYQAGNISGAVLGLKIFLPEFNATVGGKAFELYPMLIGVLAFGFLYRGDYKTIEKGLIGLVFFMSVSFVIAAVLTKPAIGQIVKGMIVPSIPEGSLLLLLGLIGTTVVPYNLFLHASLVREKWEGPSKLKAAVNDTIIAVIIGGAVSMSILIAAASAGVETINNAVDLAESLEPLYGTWAKFLLGLGLGAAGLTSAITAPLAAAFVVRGVFSWKKDLKDRRFRMVWGLVLLLGVIFASLDIKPIRIILFAQVANAVLLPVISLLLIWTMNRKSVLGDKVNTPMQNVLGILILGVCIFLGFKTVLTF